jgi:hypothetical protein
MFSRHSHVEGSAYRRAAVPLKPWKARSAFIITEEEVKYAEAALTRCTDSEIKFDAFTVTAAGQCSSAKGSNWDYLRYWRFEHIAIKANTIKVSKRLDHPYYVTDQNRALADEKMFREFEAD